MRWIAFIFLMLFSTLLALAGEPSPGPATSTTKEAKSISDVIKVQHHDGLLYVKPTTQPSDDMRDFLIPNDPARYRIRVLKSPVPQEDIPIMVIFERWMEIPGLSAQNTSISQTPRSFQISRDFGVEIGGTNLDRAENISLVQSIGSGDEPTTVVLKSNHISDGKTVQESATESDFPTLCLRHPRLVAEALIPILRDLKQDLSIISPPSEMTWRLLSKELKIDPTRAARLNEILVRLDSDEPRTRDQASRELRDFGPAAIPWAQNLDREKLTPEQAGRVDGFLRAFPIPDPADAEKLRHDPDFLLNVLYNPDAKLRALAAEQLKKDFGITIDPATTATRVAEHEIEAIRKTFEPIPTTRPATQPN